MKLTKVQVIFPGDRATRTDRAYPAAIIPRNTPRIINAVRNIQTGRCRLTFDFENPPRLFHFSALVTYQFFFHPLVSDAFNTGEDTVESEIPSSGVIFLPVKKT
jgi:hypothetical protein